MGDEPLFNHVETSDSTEATLTVHPSNRRRRAVNPKLFGKFCEHLGNNVYHGMEAQILFNPVFGEWHFRAENRRESGGFTGENDPERIAERVRSHGEQEYRRPLAYPRETDPDELLRAYRNGLAFGWMPTDQSAVETSPDTGPTGDRAQRVEVHREDSGIHQLTRLPLHRTGTYEIRSRFRSIGEGELTLRVTSRNGTETLAEISVDGSSEWKTVGDTLSLPGDLDEDGIYDVRLTAPEGTDFVVDRLLLYPSDHVDHGDPDVIRLLRDSDLPLLRWPGGNFVSGYHWRDGVGPVDDRPTRINPAWGGLEPNLFGTDEFMSYCNHVGCEPSICVNAGDGTPEEAAAWVEYCNGDQNTTEMGRLRAEHGHAEPYEVTYWEIGNELYGQWQVHWTTPVGNADRYERFREKMLEADPDIKVTATGQVTNSRPPEWNEVLLDRCADSVRALSDHILAGGRVDPHTDPAELFHAFMGYSAQVGKQYEAVRAQMSDAGVGEPKVDVTELQLFADVASETEGAAPDDRPEADGEESLLTPATLPTPDTITEALYDATLRNEFIRRGDLVEMLTHSATVNHGGGLEKRGERVWAHPCFYGRSIGTSLATKNPISVDVACDTISTDASFREIDPVDDVPAIDAMAAIDDEESELTILVVNRASVDDPVDLTVDVGEFDHAPEAEVTTLSGSTMTARNTREAPARVTPEHSTCTFEDGSTELVLDPYGMMRVTIAGSD